MLCAAQNCKRFCNKGNYEYATGKQNGLIRMSVKDTCDREAGGTCQQTCASGSCFIKCSSGLSCNQLCMHGGWLQH